MKRTRSLHLTLMTAMPAMLAACSSDDDFARKYSRTLHPTQAACVRSFQGVPNACTSSGSGTSYYGPYARVSGGSWFYLPYLAGGRVSSAGVTYDPAKRTFGSFNDTRAATALTKGATARGGFGSTAGRSSSGT